MNSIIMDLAKTKAEYALLIAYYGETSTYSAEEFISHCSRVLEEYRSLPDEFRERVPDGHQSIGGATFKLTIEKLKSGDYVCTILKEVSIGEYRTVTSKMGETAPVALAQAYHILRNQIIADNLRG